MCVCIQKLALICMLMSKVHVRPYVRHKEADHTELAMTGLDCRQPVSVRSGLLTSLCNKASQSQVGKTEDVLILQRTNTRVLKAVRCEKKISRLRQVCGSFSHSKILEPLDVLVEVPISPEDCQKTAQRLVYVKEDGQSVPIDLNRQYSYKFIEHGKLTVSVNNVACSGSKVMIHGEQHEAIVSLVTAQVVFKTVSLEMNLDMQQIVDLDMQVTLPISCARDTSCSDGSMSYAIDQVPRECNLHTVRKVKMTHVMVETEKGPKEAIVSHEHKIFLILGDQEVAGRGCEPLYSVTGTTYPDLKVVTGQNTEAAVASIGDHLPASEVNLDLEIRSSEEYLSFHLETLIQSQMTKVGEKLCSMNRHKLNQVELSPFHKDSLLRIVGDLVQELVCTPVQLRVKLGEQRSELCYTEALPAWLKTEPVWVSSLNHLVVDVTELDAVPCTSVYVPIFSMTDGALVHATPKVTEVNIPLTHLDEGYMHMLTDVPVVHEQYNKDLIYTSDEIKKFNNLIHFESTKSKVVNALTSKYCATGKCGAYRPDPGTSPFNIANLEDDLVAELDIWNKIKESAQEYGGYASIFVAMYIICCVISKLCTVFSLRCKRQIPMSLAFRYTFHLDSQMREALMTPVVNTLPTGGGAQGHPVEQQEVQTLEEGNVQDPPSTALVRYVAPNHGPAHAHVLWH